MLQLQQCSVLGSHRQPHCLASPMPPWCYLPQTAPGCMRTNKGDPKKWKTSFGFFMSGCSIRAAWQSLDLCCSCLFCQGVRSRKGHGFSMKAMICSLPCGGSAWTAPGATAWPAEVSWDLSIGLARFEARSTGNELLEYSLSELHTAWGDGLAADWEIWTSEQAQVLDFHSVTGREVPQDHPLVQVDQRPSSSATSLGI